MVNKSQIVKKILSLFIDCENVDFNNIKQYKIVNRKIDTIIKLKDINGNRFDNIEVTVGNCTICLQYQEYLIVVCPDDLCTSIVLENAKDIDGILTDYNLYNDMFELFEGTLKINSYMSLLKNYKYN
jgi:hypothetical protein